MIPIIHEEDREEVESIFGTIINYKRFIYSNRIQYLGINDYGKLLVHVKKVSYALAEIYTSVIEAFIEAFNEVIKPIIQQISESLSELTKLIEGIPKVCSEHTDYIHPPEVRTPDMNIGRANSQPIVPKKITHRNRNNC